MKKPAIFLLLTSVGCMALGTRHPHYSAHPLTPSHVHGTSSHHRGDVVTGWPAKHTFSTVTLSRANHGPINSGGVLSFDLDTRSQPSLDHLANGNKDHERWHHAISHMRAHSGHHGPPKIAPSPPGIAKVPRSAQPGPGREGLTHISASSPEMLNETSVPQPTGADTENHKDGGGAAVLPLNMSQADRGPPEKYVSPVCGNPYCKSGASRAMANPLRYPVYIFVKIYGVFGKAGAWAVGSWVEGGGHGPALSLQADHGPVPLQAGEIANTATCTNFVGWQRERKTWFLRMGRMDTGLWAWEVL